MPREAAHVEFVDDGLGEGPLERPIALPVITAGIGDDALHRDRGVAARPGRGHAVVAVGNRDGEAVWIEQDLLGVEPESTFRRERSMRAVRVDLARREAGHERMPVVVRPVALRRERDDAGRLRGTGAVEQQQLDLRGVLREHTEVDAAGESRRTQRRARAALGNPRAGRVDDDSGHASTPHWCDRADVPDITAVVANRPVRRESPDPRAVQDRHARPGRLVAIRVAHALLAVDVGLVVGEQQVVVAREQRVDERAEELAIAVRRRRRRRSGRWPREARRSTRRWLRGV